MNPLDHIMGVDEAAKLWGLTPGHIKNLCAIKTEKGIGIIQCKKIGNTWVLDKNQPNPSQPDHPHNWRAKRSQE